MNNINLNIQLKIIFFINYQNLQKNTQKRKKKENISVTHYFYFLKYFKNELLYIK